MKIRRSNKEKINRNKEYVYYTSYQSKIEDINFNKKSSMLKHKEMIELTIKMIMPQIEQGSSLKLTLFPRGLNKKYEFTLYNYCKKLLNKKEKKSIMGQKFWVPHNCIKNYIVKDKTLDSKFQIFIEFEPSYSSNETIKIHSRMLKSTYKHKNELYKDGFDIVYTANDINIRHIIEQIVTKKEYNRIEKVITVSAHGTLYSALIDKRESTTDKIGRPYFYTDRKVLFAQCKRYLRTAKMRSIINKINSFKKPQNFKKNVEQLRESFRLKLQQIINSDNESKIYVCSLTNVKSNLYNELLKIVNEETEKICCRQGIELKEISLSNKDMLSIIETHKNDCNNYAENKHFGKSYKNISKFHWYELQLAVILKIYKNFYPILKRSGTSSMASLKNNGQNGGHMQRYEKPKYVSFEECYEDCKNWYSKEELMSSAKGYFYHENKRIAHLWYYSNYGIATQWLKDQIFDGKNPEDYEKEQAELRVLQDILDQQRNKEYSIINEYIRDHGIESIVELNIEAKAAGYKSEKLEEYVKDMLKQETLLSQDNHKSDCQEDCSYEIEFI